ncbi:MAG: hypothetical protein ABI599_13030 [Flavobacteriales bacterium]
MTKNILGALLPLFCALGAAAQTPEFTVETLPVEFMGVTRPFVLWDSTQHFTDERVRGPKGLLIENEDEEALEGRRQHRKINRNALPQGLDPALQTAPPLYGASRAVDLSVAGMGYTSLNPADPCADAGPNHVIQMINGGSGGYFRIYNKSLASVGAQTYLDNFTGSVGGAGDPVVLWDGLADRWLMSEFSSSGNKLLVAISQTADPLGAWYAYSYQATNFPDYPKYGVWNDCYVVTTNESSPAIYALPRANMLAGSTGTAVRFVVSSYGTIGFQSTTPVTFDGGTAPPAGAPAMFMRMADDSWGAPADRLELWNINYNALAPANSSISGPTILNTSPFDTGLCGFTSFSCMNQPGSSTQLDPLREVLMNRICYRNIAGYEAIVCSHVTDVTGGDVGGVRWYELHRVGGIANPWGIHQQGTYSPDNNDRWMSSIAINENGDIGLCYNISGTVVYPGIRYTGRYKNDPLGQMTIAETTVIAGSASNSSNRYGDYNSLDVDPSDGLSFYGTAVYNAASTWSTRLYKFSFPVAGCTSPTVSQAVVDNCGAGTFTLSVTIGANGDSPNYDVYTSVNGAAQTFNSTRTPGTYVVGTYAFGTLVQTQVRHNANAICNQTLASITSSGATCPVTINAKVLLEGPYNSGTGTMNDALRLLPSFPLTEPYTAMGFTNAAGGGAETIGAGVLTVTGNNAIVDWVRLELRNSADPTAILATRHALVQRDGDIVSASNGTSAPTFGVGAGNYYVVVRQRNHLGAMTAGPMALSGSALPVDFTLASTLTYGTNARTSNGAVQLLWCGNTVRDTPPPSLLKYTGTLNDRDAILTAVGGTLPTATIAGYYPTDVTMDGVVKYTGTLNDRDPILVNVGGSVPTATRAEQVP